MCNNKILFTSERAEKIYNKGLKKLPIYDYHCHLKAKDIYENKTFKNITEIWLAKDHYKWRLMRANGISEKYITGDGTDKEKYLAWIKTLERSIGNPVQIWSKMELKQFFDIEEEINMENAETIWQKANSQLGEGGLSVREILKNCSVKLIGTTDNPLDDLKYHKKLKEEAEVACEVIPTMRIDSLVYVNSTLVHNINRTFSLPINNLEEYLEFLSCRIDYFSQYGCQSLDLGIGELKIDTIKTDVFQTFENILNDKKVSKEEQMDLQTFVLMSIIRKTVQKNWVLQIHIGAVGSVNRKSKIELGKGTGFDTVVDQENIASNLVTLFNLLNNESILPKVIIYNADGSKNNVVQTVIGCFQNNEEQIEGKIQHGPAWWFQDTYEGNRKQMIGLSEQGIIGNFVGMTTDSRSYISYARHDFFRRVLANIFSDWISLGILTENTQMYEILEDIAYRNAATYFNLSKVLIREEK